MNCFTNLKSNKKELWSLVKQFIKFGVVGVSNTLISLSTYYGLIYFGINYIVANTIGFIISVLNAYYWSNKYVFEKNNKGNFKAIIKTFISYGSTFILSTILLVAMVDCLNISKIIAPVLNLIITIPINFLLNKFWAFK